MASEEAAPTTTRVTIWSTGPASAADAGRAMSVIERVRRRQSPALVDRTAQEQSVDPLHSLPVAASVRSKIRLLPKNRPPDSREAYNCERAAVSRTRAMWVSALDTLCAGTCGTAYFLAPLP